MTAAELVDAIRAGTHRIKRVGSGAPWIERKTRLGWSRIRVPSHTIQSTLRRLECLSSGTTDRQN